jgi:hypothetical protein
MGYIDVGYLSFIKSPCHISEELCILARWDNHLLEELFEGSEVGTLLKLRLIN